MKISFTPQRRDDSLEITKSGDTLTINGDIIDFSVIPEGAVLPAGAVSNEFVVGEVSRVNGQLQLKLILPHGPNPSQEVAFPEDIIDPADGRIPLPTDEVQ